MRKQNEISWIFMKISWIFMIIMIMRILKLSQKSSTLTLSKSFCTYCSCLDVPIKDPTELLSTCHSQFWASSSPDFRGSYFCVQRTLWNYCFIYPHVTRVPELVMTHNLWPPHVNSKTKEMEIFQFYKKSGLPGFVYLSAFLLRNKKIHSETLLCFHSAHQESLNRHRSHSSRPIPWDILNFQNLKNF